MPMASVMRIMVISTMFVATACLGTENKGWVWEDNPDYEIFEEAKPPLGSVNGVEITLEIFREQITKVEEQYSEQIREETMTTSLRLSIEDMAWNQLVNDLLLQEQTKLHHIQVSGSEIQAGLNNPPKELLENKLFLTLGVFDPKKYHDTLATNAEFYQMMDEYARKSVPQKKLMDIIASTEPINMDSLRFEYVRQNNSVSGKLIWFNYEKMPDVSVTRAETISKLQEPIEPLDNDQFSRIKFIVLTTKPSDEDYAEGKVLIDRIYNRVVAGESFKQLAVKYSEDPGTANIGGSLGVFSRGVMVPEFEQAAFALRPGQVSKPVKTSFGWHIIKCEEVGGSIDSPSIEASHILIRVEPTESTLLANVQKAVKIREQIIQYGIDEVADIMDIDVRDSYLVSHRADSISNLGSIQGLLRFMRMNRSPAVSDVYRDSARNLVIAQLVDISKKDNNENEELDAFFAEIEIEKQKKIQQAHLQAQRLVINNSTEDYLYAAEQLGFDIIPFEDIKEGYSFDQIGPSANIVSAALTLEAGQTSGILTTDKGPVIIIAEKRVKPDVQFFNSNTLLQAEIRSQIVDNIFNKWFDDILRDADIKDNRIYYGLY